MIRIDFSDPERITIKRVEESKPAIPESYLPVYSDDDSHRWQGRVKQALSVLAMSVGLVASAWVFSGVLIAIL